MGIVDSANENVGLAELYGRRDNGKSSRGELTMKDSAESSDVVEAEVGIRGEKTDRLM